MSEAVLDPDVIVGRVLAVWKDRVSHLSRFQWCVRIIWNRFIDLSGFEARRALDVDGPPGEYGYDWWQAVAR